MTRNVFADSEETRRVCACLSAAIPILRPACSPLPCHHRCTLAHSSKREHARSLAHSLDAGPADPPSLLRPQGPTRRNKPHKAAAPQKAAKTSRFLMVPTQPKPMLPLNPAGWLHPLRRRRAAVRRSPKPLRLPALLDSRGFNLDTHQEIPGDLMYVLTRSARPGPVPCSSPVPEPPFLLLLPISSFSPPPEHTWPPCSCPHAELTLSHVTPCHPQSQEGHRRYVAFRNLRAE